MMTEDKKITLQEAHEKFAKSTFNSIWGLLDKGDRSASEDEDMLLSAFASLYHWKQIGTDVHLQRGYWMVSKVYHTHGDADKALSWAIKCSEITEKSAGEMKDFDLAYAQEGLARAYLLTGDLEKAKIHYKSAVKLGEKIKDPEDKRIFDGDIQAGNWEELFY
jgi:tetratricopeptide (TPR) repeat protein